MSDITIDEGATLVVVVTATDPDQPANTLTFSLDEGPENADFFPEAGEIRWTPRTDQAPGDYDFTVSVTDNGEPDPGQDPTAIPK